MKIFIPKHLRNLVVVNQLAEMISAYNRIKRENTEVLENMEGINQEKSLDPVKKFIYMRVSPGNSIFTEGSQNYADVINYLTALFYSVKGTQKVLEYMKKFLGFTDKEVIYDVKSISIFPANFELGDERLYYEALFGFLEELLYFEDFKTDLGPINLLIDHKVVTKVNVCKDVHCYKRLEVTTFMDGSQLH